MTGWKLGRYRLNLRAVRCPTGFWIIGLGLLAITTGFAQRNRSEFNSDWRFTRLTVTGAEQPGFDDSIWRRLSLPHDWAIEGPFRMEYPHETAKLRYWGVGWYRKEFLVPAASKGRQFFLDIDGAMSNARV